MTTKVPSELIANNAVGITQLNVSDGSAGQFLKTDGSGTLSFATVSGTTINNNADNRVITGSGTANTLEGEANFVFDGTNVGIGTTSPNFTLGLHKASSDANYIQITNSTTGSGSGDGAIIGLGSDESLNVWQFESESINFGTNNSTRMTIDSNGVMGFGTSPSGTNVGTAIFEGNVSSKDGFMTTASDLQMIAPSAGNTIFVRDNGNETMRILSTGTLLVSATTGSGLSNSTSNYGHSFGGGQQVNATNNDTNLILNMSNGSSNPHVKFRSDGGNTGSISTNGSAVAFNTGSDYRLKENVIPLKDGLNRVNKLKPVQFDWKKSQETDEGFIAHEAQEIIPYAVKGEKDGEEIQTMDYAKLTPLLVKAIQEQQEQIDALQSEINTLKGE